ncbi:PAS domain S-box protein [Thiorhodococcus fuscus]|uniref:histidine kinase n=1 Tax=Thiorhodococcus fuscus TaxID=527200 RepID=A0ABW4YAQ2_9GAMM
MRKETVDGRPTALAVSSATAMDRLVGFRCWPQWSFYLIAVLVVLLALLLRSIVAVSFQGHTFVLLLVPAILLVAAVGGLGPGLLATLGAYLGLAYTAMPPVESFLVADAHDSAQLALLVTSGVLISILCEWVHWGRRRCEAILTRQAVTLSSIGDGVITTDPEGLVTFANRAAERLLGLSAESVVGCPLSSVLHLVDERTHRPRTDALTEFLGTGTQVEEHRTVCLLSASADAISVSEHASPIRMADGRLLGGVLVLRDESRRRDAEAARDRERDLLKTLIRTLPDPVWVKDIDGRYLAGNARLEQLFGVSEAEIIGRTDYDLVAPEMADAFRHHDLAALAGEVPCVNEEEVTFLSDGHREWLETIKAPIRDARHALIGVLGIGRDITPAREAMTALRASEARYRELFESIQEGFFLAELIRDERGEVVDWRYLDVNPAHIRLLGLPRSAFVGHRLKELYPAAEDAWLRIASQVVTSSVPATFELEFSGHCSEVHFFASRSGLLACLHTDITERKAASERLRKLSQAVEQTPASVIITDTETRIDYVNPAFLRQTGYTREALLGQTPALLQSGKTPPETYASLRDALRRGDIWKGEFHNRRKDGTQYVCAAIIAPIRQPDGRITHFVSIQEDVTEHKRLASELERHRQHLEELVAQRTAELADERERAESANRAKGVFLANMSHEIRVPASIIIGLAHELRRDLGAGSQGERLARMERAAVHLLQVTNDALDLSMSETDGRPLDARDFERDGTEAVSGRAESKDDPEVTVDSAGLDTGILIRLQTLLGKGDMAANDLVVSESVLLGNRLGADYARLCALVERFEYGSALDLLRTSLSNVPGRESEKRC